MTLAKKFLKKSLAVVLVMLMTLSAFTSLVDAKGISGGGSVTVKVNKYDMTKKAVYDKTGASLVADKTTVHERSGTTFTYTPDTIDKYVYVGYYIEGVGNASNLQTGNPTVVTKADGSDCVNGLGKYTVVAVYKDDKNGNEIPDPEEKYSITERFVTQDETVIQSENKYNLDGIVEYNKMAPVITNYEYVGYFYTAAKEGYKGGSLASPITDNPAEFTLNSSDGTNSYVVTFVYKITAQPITISYDKNSATATGSMSDTPTYKGVATRLSMMMFSNPGYDFVGWATTPDGNAQYDNREIATFTADTKLYAVWNRNPSKWVNITYNKNATDATGTMASEEIVINQNYTLKQNEFDRPGYTFEGWATTPNGAKVYDNKAQVYVVGNMTLYAVWKIDASKWATITFDKNATDATGDMPTQKVVKGIPTYLNEINFERIGYVFEGWATTSAGNVAYLDQAAINASGDTVLYAVWAKDPTSWATITFDINNNPKDGGVVTSPSGTMNPQEVLIGSTIKLNSNQFKWINELGNDAEYIFLGWATDKDAETVEYVDGANITPDASMTLYAVWGTSRLTLLEFSNDLNGTDATIGQTINYSLSFVNLDRPSTTTCHQTVAIIYLGDYLHGADNVVLMKNGVAVANPNAIYNFDTKELIIEIGDIDRADEYTITWSSTVLYHAQDEDIDIGFDIDGLNTESVLRNLSSCSVHKLSGSLSTSVK